MGYMDMEVKRISISDETDVCWTKDQICAVGKEERTPDFPIKPNA